METTQHEKEAGPTHILVVDDEPDIELLMRQKMRRKIRAGKYSLDFALNGLEALEMLDEERDAGFDVIVTDINMPKMNGLELLGELARRGAEVRSIVVSAYGDMDNIRTAMNLGAFDFVTKPVDFVDLETTIERTIEHIRMWRDAKELQNQLRAQEARLDIARSLQQSILPTEMPFSHRYEIHAGLMPARDVGGDFYDIVKLENERLGLAVADTSGKGIPAALFMMGARSVLKGTAIGSSEPGTVLSEMHHIIEHDNPSSMFMTVLYMVYDPKTGEMHYANAGHPSPLVVHGDGSCSELDPVQGIAIGLAGEAEFEEGTTTLERGETLVVYSDGVLGARNESGEEFGIERLGRVFEGDAPGGAREAHDRIVQAVNGFAGKAGQGDDMTFLAVNRK